MYEPRLRIPADDPPSLTDRARAYWRSADCDRLIYVVTLAVLYTVVGILIVHDIRMLRA